MSAQPHTPRANKYGLFLTDIASFALSALVSAVLQQAYSDHPIAHTLSALSLNENLGPMAVYGGLALLGVLWAASVLRHYSHRKTLASELREIIKVIGTLAILQLALIALMNWPLDRMDWAFTWGTALALVPLGRWLSKRAMARWGGWRTPTLIIGSGENAREALMALRSQPLMGLDVIGFVSTSRDRAPQHIEGIPVWKGFRPTGVRSLGTIQVIVALEHHERQLRDDWIRDLTQQGVRDISVIPAMRGVPLYGAEISHFFSHEVLLLRVKNNLARATARWIKRAFDIAVSSALLILLMPLFAYLAFQIRKDGGPVFFGHKRIGQGGKEFPCYKFRSMVPNAQQVLQDLLAKDPAAREEWEKDFKLKNDPRITKIGKLIRKTSLDEFPQLWNVLKGDMSLVGPRPVIKAELDRYAGDGVYYRMVKPGMTGLWQVSGRNDVDYATRVYLDAWYVKNWSVWYDIAILFKTVGVVFQRTGAY
ncbi:undecaprenyl-phosphate galactose phosphotransferase WbaP [Pigmentiphaga daeguensis]